MCLLHTSIIRQVDLKHAQRCVGRERHFGVISNMEAERSNTHFLQIRLRHQQQQQQQQILKEYEIITLTYNRTPCWLRVIMTLRAQGYKYLCHLNLHYEV